MSHNVPPTPARACPIPWCESDHSGRPGHHFQVIADIEDDRHGVEIRYTQQEEGGQLGAPFLQLMYGSGWAPSDTLDIPLAAAGALADVLALLTPGGVADFIAALTRGSQGPHTPKNVQW